MNRSQRLLSEALGTFFLCFASMGAILSTAAPISSGVGLVGISLATGLALSVAVGAFGGIGGAHFNPAVTIGFFVTKRINFVESVLYIIVQLVTASIAAWACQVIWPSETVSATLLGLPFPAAENVPGVEGAKLTLGGLLMCEFILSFLLMTAIYGTHSMVEGRMSRSADLASGWRFRFVYW